MLLLVLVLVLEAIQYSNPAYWSASSREPLRSTIRIAAVQTAIEYEYRFTEYRPPRRTEYEYDEIRCEARSAPMTERWRVRLSLKKQPIHRFGPSDCSDLPCQVLQNLSLTFAFSLSAVSSSISSIFRESRPRYLNLFQAKCAKAKTPCRPTSASPST